MKSIKKKIFSNKKSKKYILRGGQDYIMREFTLDSNISDIDYNNNIPLPDNYYYKKVATKFNTNFINELYKKYKSSPHHPTSSLELKRYEFQTVSTIDININIKIIFCEKITVNLVIGEYDYTASLPPQNTNIYVIYSNKSLGGGFLTHGFSQEEIVFYEFFELFLNVYHLLQNNKLDLTDKQIFIIKNARRIFKCNVYGEDEFKQTENTFNDTQPQEPAKFEAISDNPKLTDFLVIDGHVRGGDGTYLETLTFMFNKAYTGFKTALNKDYTHIHIRDWVIGDSFEGGNKLGHNPHVMFYLQLLAAHLACANIRNPTIELTYHIDTKGIPANWHDKDGYTHIKQLLQENCKGGFTIDQHLRFLVELDKKLNDRMKIYVPFSTLVKKGLIDINELITYLKNNLTPKK
jgi:hypothetical protein